MLVFQDQEFKVKYFPKVVNKILELKGWAFATFKRLVALHQMLEIRFMVPVPVLTYKYTDGCYIVSYNNATIVWEDTPIDNKPLLTDIISSICDYSCGFIKNIPEQKMSTPDGLLESGFSAQRRRTFTKKMFTTRHSQKKSFEYK